MYDAVADPYCYPENIDGEARKLFGHLRGSQFLRGLSPEAFAQGAAHFLSELNAIHPFREGNGRAQLAFLTLLAESAGHALALETMNPDAMLSAMVASFHGDEIQLRTMIEELTH